VVGLLVLALAQAAPANTVICDADSDCFYVPATRPSGRPPALIVLSCVSATRADLDSVRSVADSLGWTFATCHGPRNRRDFHSNDADIVRTAAKLLRRFNADPNRLFVFGFSGMGVQALASLCAHPDLLRGVATTCAHRDGIEGAVLPELSNNKVFLRTRTEDWNRADNNLMYRLMRGAGVEAVLVTDSGPHSIGPKRELLEACRWLERATKP
jgi:predicted esterase